MAGFGTRLTLLLIFRGLPSDWRSLMRASILRSRFEPRRMLVRRGFVCRFPRDSGGGITRCLWLLLLMVRLLCRRLALRLEFSRVDLMLYWLLLFVRRLVVLVFGLRRLLICRLLAWLGLVSRPVLFRVAFVVIRVR